MRPPLSRFNRSLRNAVKQLRETPVPSVPSDLMDRLELPDVATRSKASYFWVAAGTVLVGGIAFVAWHVAGQNEVVSHVPVVSRSSAEQKTSPGRGVISARPVAGAGPSGVRRHVPITPGRPLVRVATMVSNRLEPTMSVRPPVVDDLAFLNPGRFGTMPVVVGIPGAQVLNLPPMRDDFVAPPELHFASTGSPDEIAAIEKDALEHYRQQANVVDGRLVQNVSLLLKHVSMDELCRELERQAGVHIAAGRNVRDDNVTIFIKKRPLRDVMREISRVFGFVWERDGEEGAYRYKLRQDTASEIAEGQLRDNDISQAIQALGRRVRTGPEASHQNAEIARQAFSELLPEELERLSAGQHVTLASQARPGEGDLTTTLSQALLEQMGGIRPLKDGTSYMSTGRSNDPDFIPFAKMKNNGVSVVYRMKITEFGGAQLRATINVYGSTDHFGGTSFGFEESLGNVPGVAEGPVHNADANAALKTADGMSSVVDLSPKPSTPLAEQGADPGQLPLNTIGTMYTSYRTADGLKPPRPFMTSDDFWEAVHDRTGRDVIADSFSRLFKLTSYRNALFDNLNGACDAMHVRWSQDEGWLVGRSRAYYWQRVNEVPKSQLLAWSHDRQRRGFTSIDSVLEMASMTDRQLQSVEVGRTIVNQWKLMEWGIPSRPMWPFDHEPEILICRFLAGLPPDHLAAALDYRLAASLVNREALDHAKMNDVYPQSVLGVDYVPAGKYYWSPTFEVNKEVVHSDLIFGDTLEAVKAEVRRRYPDRPVDDLGEISLSDGVLTILVKNGTRVTANGDFRFGVGHRGPIE